MSNLSDLMTALGTKQTTAVSGSNTVPYYLHWQENFPYWTNRVIDSDYEWESGELQVITQRIAMRLVGGHITSGYDGESEDNIYTYIQAVRAEFADCTDLLRSEDYVLVDMPTLISDTGFEGFPDPSLPVIQAGVEFILEVRIWHQGP